MGTKAPSPFFSRVSGNKTSQKMAERMLSDIRVRGDISTFVFECLWPHVLIFVTRCWDSLQLNTGCFKPFVQTEPGRTAEQRGISASKSMKPLDIFKKETSGHFPVTSLQVWLWLWGREGGLIITVSSKLTAHMFCVSQLKLRGLSEFHLSRYKVLRQDGPELTG